MKTPEEWLKSKTHCVNKNVITDRFKAQDIAAIQSDARQDLAEQVTKLLDRLQAVEKENNYLKIRVADLIEALQPAQKEQS